MTTIIPFQLKLQGGDANQHEVPAYDGYMALAGFGLSLSLVSNYVETGKIRRRGDFIGRSSVKAKPISEGSIVSDFIVNLDHIAILATSGALSPATSVAFFYDIFKRTIDRNLGIETSPQTLELEALERSRVGDLEALVVATEHSVKQSHSVIGEGAKIINIYGGTKNIARYDANTKSYVEATIRDNTIKQKDVSVAAFNVNSGHGSVWDSDLNRVISIMVTKETLYRAKSVLTWGLNEYANGTGKKISLKYFSILAFDGTAKKYIVVDAEIPEN